MATARDRCDQTIDRIRSIRTDRFRFTRNYMLDRVLLQPQYRDKKEFVVDLRQSYANGTLDPKLAEIYFGERPPEELYDVKVDPAQLNNLIVDPKYADEVARHRKSARNAGFWPAAKAPALPWSHPEGAPGRDTAGRSFAVP